MPESGRLRKEIFLHGDDNKDKKVVIEDDGTPKRIVVQEAGKAERIILDEVSESENSRQTIVIRQGGRDNVPKRKWLGVAKMAIAAIPFAAGAGYLVYQSRPQDPILEVKDIRRTGFDLHTSTESMLLAVLDIKLTLVIRIENPNITAITFDTTILNIYYKGSILGQTKLYPGDQGPRSAQVLELPCTMSGLEATHHLGDLFFDVTRRVMTLDARATIKGNLVVMRYRHYFEVYVKSHLNVDPLFLDVIGQNHRADIKIAGVSVPKLLDK